MNFYISEISDIWQGGNQAIITSNFPCFQGYYQQPSPTSPEQPDWFARHVVDSDIRSHSPNRDSPGSSNRNSAASSGSGGYLVRQEEIIS